MLDQKGKEIQQNLVKWYLKEKRDLPWRHTTDPYHIWISEVMLQQTRVDTVIPYYNRFTKAFPTMHDLANAEEEELLKLWEGLGYYSRARNLQQGVKEVIELYDAKVPNTREQISAIRGIGPYTAGAILSIAYGVPEHAVDGNVMRVLSRLYAIEEDIAKPKAKKIFEDLIMMIIDKEDPSSFNQGVMELGATICTPGKPKCLLCPVREQCAAFEQGKTDSLPIKSKKSKVKKITYNGYMLKRSDGKWLVEQREEGLLAKLWQYPLIETNQTNWADLYGITWLEVEKVGEVTHLFSHLKWEIEVFVGKVEVKDAEKFAGRWVTEEELNQLPLPVPIQKMRNLAE
ncbi:A/G-specific adenine glycosylase [Chryseomicrobium aureum]|uniref:A/G-specific adenine glycosylase n=1 Tax=Chryseomicrobium aureum TaxID=1441723 RepID=UPI00195C325A|nr:A/G-specific adenine glycosylase [Chryseomicrobium aureum]MBM7707417.1 A/G-specific adenine glycosylase [Chryseomicrobium aureum]